MGVHYRKPKEGCSCLDENTTVNQLVVSVDDKYFVESSEGIKATHNDGDCSVKQMEVEDYEKATGLDEMMVVDIERFDGEWSRKVKQVMWTNFPTENIGANGYMPCVWG